MDKQFILKENKVCINSNEYRVYEDLKTWKYIKINTAYIEGSWRGSISLTMGNYGGGSLPSPFDKPFINEKECFENAINEIQKYLIDNETMINIKKITNKILLAQAKFFPKTIQLKLF
jgi:hypothetical protein